MSKSYIFEFSLNNFPWIQQIKWIVIKSKSCMVTRDILHLTIVTFLDVVVNSNFPLLSVGWYLFRVVCGNRYLPRDSNENTLCITSTGNVSVSRWAIPLLTMRLLDLVMIHWIRWIQRKSFWWKLYCHMFTNFWSKRNTIKLLITYNILFCKNTV